MSDSDSDATPRPGESDEADEPKLNINIDYYADIGVHPDASSAEIKHAYHKQILQYHPDKAGNDPEAEDKARQLNRAWEILSSQVFRAQYDAGRKNGAPQARRRRKGPSRRPPNSWREHKQQPKRPQRASQVAPVNSTKPNLDAHPDDTVFPDSATARAQAEKRAAEKKERDRLEAFRPIPSQHMLDLYACFGGRDSM